MSSLQPAGNKGDHQLSASINLVRHRSTFHKSFGTENTGVSDGFRLSVHRKLGTRNWLSTFFRHYLFVNLHRTFYLPCRNDRSRRTGQINATDLHSRAVTLLHSHIRRDLSQFTMGPIALVKRQWARFITLVYGIMAL